MEMTLKEKRTKAEPGSASPLESDGKINLITSKCSDYGASSQGLQRGCRHWAKLNCVSTTISHGRVKRNSQSGHRPCLRHERRKRSCDAMVTACMYWAWGFWSRVSQAYCLPRHLNKASSTRASNRGLPSHIPWGRAQKRFALSPVFQVNNMRQRDKSDKQPDK